MSFNYLDINLSSDENLDKKTEAQTANPKSRKHNRMLEQLNVEQQATKKRNKELNLQKSSKPVLWSRNKAWNIKNKEKQQQ